MKKEQYIKALEASFAECIEVSKRKSHDYAGDEDAFNNFKTSLVVGVPIERAILVRIMDKISRANQLLDNEAQVADEKLDDTLLDLVNYANILRVYLKQ